MAMTSVFDFQVAPWTLCGPADAHLALCCLPIMGRKQPFSTALSWMDVGPAASGSACIPQGSTALQGQGSQTTGLDDVAAKCVVSKMLLLVLIIVVGVDILALPCLGC